MKRSAFDERKDQKTADNAGPDRALMCRANGCPNRWVVDAGEGRVCAAHSQAQPHDWPMVTQRQQWDETEQARMNSQVKAIPQPLTAAEKREVLRRLGEAAGLMRENQTNPRRWAELLREREKRGEVLSEIQRSAWRSALGQSSVAETLQ